MSISVINRLGYSRERGSQSFHEMGGPRRELHASCCTVVGHPKIGAAGEKRGGEVSEFRRLRRTFVRSMSSAWLASFLWSSEV